MTFIGQVALSAELFPGSVGKVAYVFMTGGGWDVDDTYSPDGGENAVIIQPGGTAQVPVASNVTGPSVTTRTSGKSDPASASRSQSPHWIKQLGALFSREGVRETPQPINNEVVYLAELTGWDDIESNPEEENEGTKIGGNACFLQSEEYPDEVHRWKLLLQLDSQDIPFELNLGDAGVAYAFVNEDATVGKMLWQCC